MTKLLWNKVLGKIDSGPLTLESIERSGKPNDALIGPERLKPDAVAPVFIVNPWELWSALLERIDREKVEWLEKDREKLYARAATYSPGLKFPDINHFWVVPIEEDKSTVAFYAAARLGYSDMGKNRKRLDGWLRLLDDLTAE